MVIPYHTFTNPDGWIYHGDCREVMKNLQDCSVDSVVTDPPYELGFMGKAWDRSGVAYDVSVWQECLRVLKPGAHLLAFGGSRTYHRLACAVEDAGFEIRDQIQWIYGSGFPKSKDVSKAIDEAAGVEREVVGFDDDYARRNPNGKYGLSISGNDNKQIRAAVKPLSKAVTDAAKQWDGWGTALKPAHEPIVLARKPLIGTVAENVLQHGTGGLNIDGCRIGIEERTYELKGGENLNVLARPQGNDSPKAKGCGAFGIGAKQINVGEVTVNGRWPANVIHDGSDEVLAGFPEGESGVQRKPFGTGGIWSGESNDPCGPQYGDNGSAARFFYCAKASKEDREEGLEDLPIRSAGAVTDRKDGTDGLNSPRAGAGRTSGSRNHHPTVKPTDLMRYLCRLVTPPNGTVLDPFFGAGSTGKAARREGFKIIGIELDEESCELAVNRCHLTQQPLFFI